MSKPDWDPTGCHPTPGLLLRYSELDLSGGEMEDVREHLQRCWSCSAELENLKQGIWAFMEFREKVLLPGVPVDGTPGPVRQALIAASSEEGHDAPAWQDAARRFFTLISAAGLRPAWIAGAVSAAAIFAFIYLGMMSPPPLLASEFIHNVRNSLAHARKSESGKLVVQKIRVRRGGFITEREITSSSRNASSTAGLTQPLWLREMSTALTWENPLSFDSILDWRARQRSLSENVSIVSGLVTLRLTVEEPNTAIDENVREVVVSARKTDWHVISKRVEFRYGPSIEATEVAYSVAAPPVPVTLTRSATTMSPYTTTRSSGPTLPVRRVDLDWTEVRVREVLFQSQANLTRAEVPLSLSRTAGSIRVDGVISDPTARNELKRALAAIPNISDQIRSAAAVGAPQHLIGDVHSVLSKTADPEIVDPPLLRKKLTEHLGSEEQATEFANRILAESGKSFSLSVQYHDLARRFPSGDEKLLTEDVRIELDNLAREMETALRAQLNHEAEWLGPILGEEFRPQTAIEPDWQKRADTLFQLASQKQQSVSRLFAVTGHAASEETSVEVELGRLTKCMQDMKALIP